MAMLVTNTKLIAEYSKKHNQASGALRSWLDETKRANWSNFHDIRASYRHADYVDGLVIFNINGNNHRLVVEVQYVGKYVVVKWIGTHAEYDKKNRKGGFKL
ncbi:type II toxin-antitoxin system HigB family toxin [Hafnia paralvei]|uniref:type II toxin-antitoxin system HigB family toxin n=1 Tax=Hafnia paralvei TaxID=546367 RepID=UPI0021089783|nr:type II toxin-antitoxin system HigB family toxin [Hafnia paralvei]MCQ4169720.1 type II toxin-antitoxin system HigB family toxin [Hafnia paralvei]